MGISQMVAGLRSWTAGTDPHVRAAVELLIGHGAWLERSEFVDSCVRVMSGGREYWISWGSARELFDAGVFAAASTTEQAVLDFAVALGEDRFRISLLDVSTRRLVWAATTGALGVGA